MLIDAHAHIFKEINGLIGRGRTKSAFYGNILVGRSETLRVMPPLSRDTSFPPEVLLQYMDWAGVDKAVLLQGPFYGEANLYVHKAVKRWQDRFIGAAYFDPWVKGAGNTFCLLTEKMGFRIFKMELSEDAGYAGFHPALRLNDTRIEWLWEEIEKRRFVIVLDLGPIGGKAYQTKPVKEILDRHPDLRMVITHLSYPPLKKQHDKRLNQLWTEQVLLARHPGVWLDLASLPAHANSAGEDYPYPGACEYIRKAIKLVGADKLLWGTDIPGLLSVTTYSQLLTYITNHCDFRSASSRAKILGGNALQAYGEVMR